MDQDIYKRFWPLAGFSGSVANAVWADLV